MSFQDLIKEINFPTPDILEDPATLKPIPLPGKPVEAEVGKSFKKSALFEPMDFEVGQKRTLSPMRVGVVFSGGQASGGHNVIYGLLTALKKIHPESVLLGFLNGPIGVINNCFKQITQEVAFDYKNQGGFDLIGSGRDKIETKQQFEKSAKTAKINQLDGLVIIGGDDSNTNAALLAEYFLEHNISTTVVGVPKTIDGDLKNDQIEKSFGFDTATKTFSATIGNILRDALSAKKYTFFIKLMGRSASHIALECALNTRPNICLIGEKIASDKQTFSSIVRQIAEMVEKRADAGKHYGCVLIPEGVIEFIPEFKQLILEINQNLLSLDQIEDVLSQSAKDCFESLPRFIQEQLLQDRDPHGNVQVSKIETERLFIAAVQEELKRRGVKKFSAQPLFLGYEGRSCYPSPFDASYCLSLGKLAAVLITNRLTGYMATLSNLGQDPTKWQPKASPLVQMIHFEERKGKRVPVIKKGLVDLNAEPYLSFAKESPSWILEDHYLYPGPIQYK